MPSTHGAECWASPSTIVEGKLKLFFALMYRSLGSELHYPDAKKDYSSSEET
jgi:hypothetical protein